MLRRLMRILVVVVWVGMLVLFGISPWCSVVFGFTHAHALGFGEYGFYAEYTEDENFANTGLQVYRSSVRWQEYFQAHSGAAGAGVSGGAESRYGWGTRWSGDLRVEISEVEFKRGRYGRG